MYTIVLVIYMIHAGSDRALAIESPQVTTKFETKEKCRDAGKNLVKDLVINPKKYASSNSYFYYIESIAKFSCVKE